MAGSADKDPKRAAKPAADAAWSDEKKRLLERVGVLENALKLKAADDDAKLARSRVEKLERELQLTERKLSAAIEDGRAAAAHLETARRDRDRLETDLATARAQLDKLTHSVAGLEARCREAEHTLAESRQELRRTSSRLEAAERDLRAKGRQPLLPAAELAHLTTDFLRGLEAQLPGLHLRDGELRLKVAAGKDDGGQAGFQVVTADAPPEIRNTTHEFVLRFGRTGPET